MCLAVVMHRIADQSESRMILVYFLDSASLQEELVVELVYCRYSSVEEEEEELEMEGAGEAHMHCLTEYYFSKNCYRRAMTMTYFE